MTAVRVRGVARRPQMHTKASMQVIECHVADHLLQNDVIVIRSVILGEIISEYSHLLIRTALTTLNEPEDPQCHY